jgi:two-component sensor histidine kinase
MFDPGSGAWWHKVWRFLFSPHLSVQGDEARFRATMVSVLTLGLALLSVVGAFAEPINKMPLLAVAVLRLLLYLFSRCRYHTLAAHLVVAETLVFPYIVLALLPTFNPGSVGTTLQWQIIPVFLAGVVLNIYGLALTIILVAGGLVASALVIPGLAVAELAPTIGLTLNVAVFSLVTATLQRRYFAQRAHEEAQIRESLHEKEILLKEIHHRVKNNLQVVSSLLSLQAGQTADETALTMLNDSRNRVRAMALIHERLYRSSDLARIDFAEYIQGLTRYLVPAYEPADHLTFTIQADGVWLSLDSAVQCGLIINELVSNALKHAFPNGRRGHVEVSATADRNQIRLVVADDGVGIPSGKDPLSGDTLGMQLVHSLVGQLGGELVQSGENGTRYEITFCDGARPPDYLTDSP